MFLSVAQTPKNQSDSSFALLQLKKLYFYHSKESCFPPIHRSLDGKPFFASRSHELSPWQFNLSHSKGWVVVALGHHPVGVDLQVFRPVSDSLLARVCSPSERQWLSSLPLKEQEQGFAFLWSGKEALCKESGVGIGSGKKLASLSLEPSQLPDPPTLPIQDFSIISHETTPPSPLARLLTPHFALAVSGLGVTSFGRNSGSLGTS